MSKDAVYYGGNGQRVYGNNDVSPLVQVCLGSLSSLEKIQDFIVPKPEGALYPAFYMRRRMTRDETRERLKIVVFTRKN